MILASDEIGMETFYGKLKSLSLLLLWPCLLYGNLILPTRENDEIRAEMIVELVTSNLNHKPWRNIIYFGDLLSLIFERPNDLKYTFVVSNFADEDYFIENPVPYYSNFILIDCKNFSQLQETLSKVTSSPYWHPLSSIALYYHETSREEIARIFYIFWYYRASNVIIIQYDDSRNHMLVSYFNPYVSEGFRLQNNWGCWKTSKINRPVTTFEESFACEDSCSNVSVHSKLRADHLGTCIGYDTIVTSYGDTEIIKNTNFFEDKSKNLHGFTMRAHAIEVLSFFEIVIHDNDTYSFKSRDGLVWMTMAELMNFTIDLTPISKSLLKQPFNVEVNLQLFYTFALRQAELLLYPIYQIDYIIAEVDTTVAFKEGGVCIISHRAGYETILFDYKLLQDNFEMAIRFFLCFILIWCLFITFNFTEKERITLDQVGKDLMNTIRNVLSLTLHKPPKRETFRIYLTISLWGFFVMNFASQAAIISFFTTYKRGKEVETFEDILEKGYPLESIATPDSMLPDTEERYRKINARFVFMHNLFECVDNMLNDSKRFCMMDCAIGFFLARNRINKRGEQYLHIAKDKIHNNYLNMLMHKHSPLTERFNRYMSLFVEAGLIKKWEEYISVATNKDIPVKPLTMEDLNGIFQCLFLFIAISSLVFAIEVTVGNVRRFKRYLSIKCRFGRGLTN